MSRKVQGFSICVKRAFLCLSFISISSFSWMISVFYFSGCAFFSFCFLPQCIGLHLCVCVCAAFWEFRCMEEHSSTRDTVAHRGGYQQNAASWDKWWQLPQYWLGLIGAENINICMTPFHVFCGVLCCYGCWHSAGQALITHGWESVTVLFQLLWSAARL